MARVHTTIAQWGLVSGIRQDESDLALVVPAPSRFAPEARKGQLLVVVEAEGDVSRGRNACALVASTIRDAYYEDASSSITSSLRKALKAANGELYRFNFEAPAHKRATVGVTCAVIHGQDLFIAQVPPAQAYVSHAGKLRAVPNPLSWTGGALGGRAVGYSTALGTSLGSEAEFFRSVLQPGDIVTITSSNIARLLGKAQAEQLICLADAATIAHALYELCRRNHLPEAHALVVEIMPELSAEARHAPLSRAGVSERGKLAAERVGEWGLSLVAEARRTLRRDRAVPATAVKDEGVTDSALAAVADEQEPMVVEGEPAAFLPPPGIVPALDAPISNGHTADAGSLIDRVPVGDPDPLPLSAFIGEGPYGGIVRPPAPKREKRVDLGDNQGMPVDFAALPRKAEPPPPTFWDRLTLPLRMTLVAMLGALANLPRRLRHAERPRAFEGQQRPMRTKVKGLSYRRERTPIPWLNLLLIVGVLTLLVVVGLQQNRRRDQRTVDTKLAQVESTVTAAEAAPSDADAQQRLRDAAQALDELAPLQRSGLLTETKTVSWSRYQQILQHYDRARASINRIGVLENLQVVATLPNPNAQIARLVVATDPTSPTGLLADRLFVLDRGGDSGTVYGLEGGAFKAMLAPGQEAGSGVAGKIRDLLWREGEPMAVDRDESNPFNAIATVYLHGDKGWLANRLQGSELLPLGSDIPAASFGGNFYLWDRKKQQLMKYGSGYFGDLPSQWITNKGGATLDQVAGVQIDGDIYLLQTDGSISIFRGGAFQRTLPAPKVEPPVQTITRFYVSPKTGDELTGDIRRDGAIFLLDTLNERVIELNKKDGAVLQQLQMRERGPLNRLSDLQVDSAHNVIYLANGNQVLRAQIPQPVAPPAREARPAATTTATP